MLAFNGLLFQPWGSVANVVFLGLVGGLGIGWYGKQADKKLWPILAGIGIAGLLGLGNILRVDNHVVSGISNLVVWGSMGLAAYTLLARRFPASMAELLQSPLTLAVGYIQGGWGMVQKILSGEIVNMITGGASTHRKSPILAIGLGLAAAIPVVGVLTGLLAGADPVFETLVSRLGTLDWLGDLPGRLIISGIVTGMLIPATMVAGGWKFKSAVHGMADKLNLKTEMTVVMTAVGLLFGLYLFVQWPYVFATVAAETDLAKYGVATYSEYVKRGFEELVVAGMGVYGLAAAGLVIWRSGTSRRDALWWVLAANLVLLMVFLVSIARRVWLYQAFHGLSLVRFYGAVVVIWLAGMVVFLGLRHVWAKKWVVAEVVFTAIVAIIFGWSNPEHYIAAYFPPTVNGRVDYVYLAALSADGIGGWKKSLRYAESVLGKYETETVGFVDREERREAVYAGWVAQTLMGKYHGLLEKYGTEEDRDRLRGLMRQAGMVDVEMLVPNRERQFSSGIRQWPWWYDLYESQASTDDLFFIRNWRIADEFTPWERLLVWNASEARAYAQANDENWPERLIRLQGQFKTVFMRVRSQPESERGYDVDISPGPFLEW